MVRPDVLVSYEHSSSKTTTGATVGPLLTGKASQPIWFLPARPGALWILAISPVHSGGTFCFCHPKSFPWLSQLYILTVRMLHQCSEE